MSASKPVSVLLLASTILLSCQGQSRAPIVESEIFHLSLKRELDAEGRENACIAGGTLPLTSDARGLVHFSVVGCDDTCIKKSSLSIVCKAALESVDSLVLSGPTKCDGGGWVLYLAANLRNRQVMFDISGVDEVTFADDQRRPWPLVLRRNGVALEVTYTDGGKKAHINKVIEASLDR